MPKRSSETKAELIAELEAEARRLGGGVTANQRRWMKAAATKGKELEPAGAMASSKSARGPVGDD